MRNLQGEFNRLSAMLLLTALFPSFSNCAGQQPPAAPQSLEGLWVTDGYGILLEFQGRNLRTYEITTLSCIGSEQLTRKTDSSTGGEIVFEGEGDTLRVFPATSEDMRWLHEDGSISNILLRRTTVRPQGCKDGLRDTPLTNYQVFWETFAEQYAFFGLHHVDWTAVDKEFRPRVGPQTQPEELFQIFSDMIEPLHDGHTFISAPSIKKRFRGRRPNVIPLQKEDTARITEIIETKYVRGELRTYCNGRLQFGVLRSAEGASVSDSGSSADKHEIGYLRIHSFARYSQNADAGMAEQLDALEKAFDDIFKDSGKLAGLIVDVRINTGGSDVFGISIASRLASHEYVAYKKAARNDIRNPDHRTSFQSFSVHVSQRPGFRGPVVLLTSGHGVSAAESFVMAMVGRHPHATRIGTPTFGIFSDDLNRTLPNGWNFGLSNEIYQTEGGTSFEGSGVPPDIEVPFFSKEELVSGRDAAIEKALEVLARKPN